MFRVLLTAYVAAVMLAGPSVCCCTTARVVAGCFAAGAGEAEAAPAPCCCGHQAPRGDAENETPAAADEGSGCPSAPAEEHECPCRKHKGHAVAEARKQVADLQLVRAVVPAPLDANPSGTAPVEIAAVCEAPQVPNRASHFGSARELLNSLRTYLI